MSQSNTEEFVKFVNDAANAVTDEGTPVLQIGALLVADNASIHRFEAVIYIVNLLSVWSWRNCGKFSWKKRHPVHLPSKILSWTKPNRNNVWEAKKKLLKGKFFFSIWHIETKHVKFDCTWSTEPDSTQLHNKTLQT